MMLTSSPQPGETEVGEQDVLIVGYGPVGMVLSILLAQRGWSVTVVERWESPYGLPRAVAFDTEAARILAATGIGEFLADFGEPAGEYTWCDPEGRTLLYSAISERGWCGWPDSTSMYQPGLESALTARGARLPTLRVLRGYEAEQIVERDDGVELVAGGPQGTKRTLRARWIVGCDGANSFVRRSVDSAVTDFDFSHDWLICDVVVHEDRRFDPNNLQICDPARPRTSVSAGPGHRRWEFMRVPGETIEELNSAEAAWRLLGMFDVTPDNATLDRFAVYTFQARYVDRWREGRTLLAGDAAHLMPPFAGQGMSSGFRDALNLAWKLDLVLSGQSGDSLLDTYPLERKAHVRNAVETSLKLGRVICQVDAEEAADLHAVLLGVRERGMARSSLRPGVHPLVEGVLDAETGTESSPGVGELTPQGRVSMNGESGLFDEIVERGWVFLTAEDPATLLDADRRACLERVGARVVHLVPGDTPDPAQREGCAADLDGVYLPFLAEHDAVGVVVRPDFYVFGTVPERDRSTAVVDRLRDHLFTAALAS